MHHEVKFERNTRDGKWRGFCAACMWCRVGTREEVQALAATHDIDWVEADPEWVESDPATPTAGCGVPLTQSDLKLVKS